MFKMLSFAGIGLLAACLTLSTPSVSQAHDHGYSYRNYGGHGYRNYNGYGRGYSGYGYQNYSGYGYGHGHGYGRRAVVHPKYLHWTPSRGLHTHGHLHVPHRGHYHTFRY